MAPSRPTLWYTLGDRSTVAPQGAGHDATGLFPGDDARIRVTVLRAIGPAHPSQRVGGEGERKACTAPSRHRKRGIGELGEVYPDTVQ